MIATCSNKILTKCECGGEPRPSLYHNKNCPKKLSFYGAPYEWGVGFYNEKRRYKGLVYKYTYTWEPIYSLKKERMKKIKKLNLYG